MQSISITGRSEQKLDDRIRVHFGGPGGAEAHARCAVKTALQMLQGFERIKYSKKRKHPCPRIYILVYSFNTILSIPRQKQEYPNILSHKAAETLSLLESLNFDHKVVISHETYTSVRHFFDCRKIQDLAKTDAQTKSPIAYQVISDLNILTIFDGTYAEKVPPHWPKQRTEPNSKCLGIKPSRDFRNWFGFKACPASGNPV